MSKGVRALAAVCVLLLVGCGERKAEIGKPKSYAKDGMQFQYPGNWRITEDKQEGTMRYVFVETPGDAIVVVQIYPAAEAKTLADFTKQFSANAQASAPIGNVGASTFGQLTNVGGYEALDERFSITLAGTSVPHTRLYRRKAFGASVCFLIAQVADEDQAKVTEGFEQIFGSFQFAAASAAP